MLSRCVINRRQSRELEKHQDKNTSIDEKEKVEMKLHASLILNVTRWGIYEPRRDTQRSGSGKGFNDRVSFYFLLRQRPGEKNHFVSKSN